MRVLLFLLFAILVLNLVEAEESNTTKPPLVDPTILLIRDDSVRTALGLTEEQRASLDQLLHQHNRMLLAIRDVSPSGADKTAQPALREIHDALAKQLTLEQRLRLQGLVLQAQGYDALLRKDMVTGLKLSEEQQTKLTDIGDKFHKQAQEAQQQDRAGHAEKLASLQAERHKQIIAILDDQQETKLGKLLGEPFDFTKVVKSPAWAPEFADIEEWIHTEPLTLASLRGKVVVVHFFAFGCSNCINNFPWYREWHEAFQGQDFALIGIHTPETKTEEDNNLLRAALDQHQLKFPVAVDKQKTMWQAWYNGVWPSVYLIDRQGRVRYWWYGELNWQKSGNQQVARRQIEELLAEPR